MSLILMPFSWLITTFCHLFANNYGMALILFAIVVKVILFPFSLKGKRSMVRMSAVQGKAQRIQKQYANNRQKQQEELQKLYAKENVNPMSGCLWSFLPLLLLLPLYSIIRQPLTYMMDMTADAVQAVAQCFPAFDLAANPGYGELHLAALITPENLETVRAGMADAAKTLFAGQNDVITSVVGQAGNLYAIDFNFLGLDLSQQPTFRIWENWSLLGVNLLPVLSAAMSVVMSIVTQKTNRMSNPGAAEQKSNFFMLYVFSPLMSLWIGYIMPAGLCIYWIVNSLLSMLQEFLAGKLLKKDYEEAAENARKQALLDKEEEKRRKAALSAERAKRAAEKKQKGKKKDKDKAPAGVDVSASRVGIRAYARGRAYDPDRFGGVTPYRDPDHPVDEEAIEKVRAQREEKREEAQLEADVTAKVAAEMEELAAGSADELEKKIEQLEEDRAQEVLDEADALAATLNETPDEDPSGDSADD